MRPLLIVLVALAIGGCRAAATEQTFTVRAAPQLEAQADLATTAHAAATRVDTAGTAPHSPDSSFVAEATGIWQNQTGPGNELAATAATLAQENKRISAAKLKAEQDAETERRAHMKQLKELMEKNEALAGQLNDAIENIEKIKADRSTAEMWAKLLAIALVGGVATGAALWFGVTRKFAPLIAIGFAGLAGVVVIRAVAGDILIVVVLAVVLAALYGLGMWLWEHRNRLMAEKIADAQEQAIEQLPKPVADIVKPAVRAVAGDMGVQPQLIQRLVDKGYSSPDSAGKVEDVQAPAPKIAA